MIAITISCLLFSLRLIFAYPDYYWRDFTGEIPLDALSGGNDSVGQPFYIGQAVIPKECISVVQIFRGHKEVFAPCYGVKADSQNVKILCTNKPDKFEWISTTKRRFHEATNDKHLVLGGYDFRNGQLHIGRVVFDGSTKIGSVASYAFENAYLYFPAAGKEQKAELYEVLAWNNSTEVHPDARDSYQRANDT